MLDVFQGALSIRRLLDQIFINLGLPYVVYVEQNCILAIRRQAFLKEVFLTFLCKSLIFRINLRIEGYLNIYNIFFKF